MKTESPNLSSDDIQELVDAYDAYLNALRWDRDHFVDMAERVCALFGQDAARRMIKAQARRIREQANR